MRRFILTLLFVVRYRDLLQVEELFRRAKAVLRSRPIYHSSDAAIRGHVFCSFLALVLQKELADQCRAADVTVEWGDLLRDLDRLQGKRLPQLDCIGRSFYHYEPSQNRTAAATTAGSSTAKRTGLDEGVSLR
jgi:hypothetical protein